MRTLSREYLKKEARSSGACIRNKQVAERLFISETTVRHHLTAIFAKLGVADRLELVIYAYRHSLAGLPF
jgi:two-component system, NarL family, nitrate/nitrite response regulator NarL